MKSMFRLRSSNGLPPNKVSDFFCFKVLARPDQPKKPNGQVWDFFRRYLNALTACGLDQSRSVERARIIFRDRRKQPRRRRSSGSFMGLCNRCLRRITIIDTVHVRLVARGRKGS